LDDIATLRVPAQDATVDRTDAKGAGEARIAIGHLVDEQKIANQQCILHRPRVEPERLEEQGSEHTGDQQGIDDGLDGFNDAAVSLRLGRHAG
jgi:hypothetical protein